MWCASCRGSYLAVRRLLPDLSVVDQRKHRQSRFDPEKLRRSFAEPVRKVPGDGFRDPYSGDILAPAMALLAGDYVLDYAVEELARGASEPNGEVTTDEIATVVLRGLYRMHPIAFLRSALHHRLMPQSATDPEIAQLAEVADLLVARAHAHSADQEFTWPALREPPSPMLCPRCGLARIARRSRAGSQRGLDQQPASCGFCGQRFTLEWGSHAPLLVTSDQGDSLFDVERFRGGIRSAVRKLPGSASIWSDEKLVVSAAHTAATSAIPFIRGPGEGHPIPSLNAGDLWLAAAAALRGIHPLAFVRYAMHSGAVDDLARGDRDIGPAFRRMEGLVTTIARRYFGLPRFPAN
jgi:transcriptional regulator NrdR family protein